ncbi:unnamed protein product [Sphagnum jensenii]|uniref:Phosphosulfolactate synthase n=1 Tax=Sphagnum jensenii TaxID=128206 RepID=A0ABP1A7J7_9BRYO
MESREHYYVVRPQQPVREQLEDGGMARIGMPNDRNFYFRGLNGWPQRPRIRGMTEVRGPFSSLMAPSNLQDVLETMGQFMDGLRFSGGSFSLMPHDIVRQLTRMAHNHDVYVSSGGWADHVLAQGPSVFRQYVQECKDLGFDAIEVNTDLIGLQEEDLLHLIRTIKSAGLKARPELGIKSAEDGIIHHSNYLGGFDARDPESEGVNWVIRRAERFLEAGADAVLIDSDGITENVGNWRTDVIARVIERLGLEKIMFEAADPRVFEWFIQNYGSKVNLFVDHSHLLQLEGLRSGIRGGRSVWGHFLL